LGYYKTGLPCFIEDILYAESEILRKRELKSRTRQGIVAVKTIDLKEDGAIVMVLEGSWKADTK